MKGTPEVIKCLNETLTLEATLNEQYRLNERVFKFIGLKSLKDKMEEFGCDASDYRRDMLDRVMFLGGTPEYTIGTPTFIEGVTAILNDALARETALVAAMNDHAIVAMTAKDDNTRNKFEHWIKWHENHHISWIEKKLRLIDVIGEAGYVQEEM